ncbi:exo-beta-N-acetylmuramidase NamZ domain-containing protein [Bythopirellula goksoeyrii]|uniref:Esterase EstB n=1 Tax=Bythopirellula goksoeyrii TaxID=1400387 RepID=A0A5B9QHW0_9BACT|nr:exo-beta-N-acetylmuramidase NamZ domain-containing protein [Bythopirellula goksoeyrii]QEG37170.1 Esterase EstB [Bythopirellula goksoeyrii]
MNIVCFRFLTFSLLASCALLTDALPRSLAFAETAELPRKSPAELGLQADQLDRIDELVAAEIEKGNLPGCVVMIGRRGGIGFARAYGHRQLEPTSEEMTLDTVFDLASLTKPLATATSIMKLVERGQVRLREPVATYIPEFAQNGKNSITIEHLLTHQGGLIPDNPLADYEHGSEEAWKNIWELAPRNPVGTKFAYTDVGFLVLGQVIERVTGKDVATFARENIFEPLGMSETGYLPEEELRARAATTEKRDDEWLRGEVHDPRAALLGGVAGHAGLFSTAGDIAKYAQMILDAGKVNGSQLFSPLTIAEMGRRRNVDGNERALGWDSLSKYSSNRGELFSDKAIGHGGFTGTALWIDPELDLFVVFLSSRLHPDGEGSVNPLAGRIGTIAAASIDAKESEANDTVVSSSSSPADDTKNTLLGIDVLERDQFALLKGRRVGLITNHTGLNSAGERTIDLLHAAPNVELISIFSPEHGLQGKLDEPNISDTRDEATGLPVHSLYGESRKPDAKQLEGIDTLVFDIQDIGTRFYTYISTMGLALEAAGEHDLKFVVLDRPNPLGGVLVEGPVLDLDNKSFVGFHEISVRHGMTMGELAQMFQAEDKLDVDLQVVNMEHWSRDQHWDQTGLVWTNPSPNMRSLTQALLYPGIGLLETTNLSVGRGTDTPFEVIGAPWIDATKLAQFLNQQNMPGVTFVPIRFTPRESKFAKEACEGINVIVVDRQAFEPVRTGLVIALALRELFPQDWDMARYNRLLANDQVYSAISEGTTIEQLNELIAPALEDFKSRRREFLIYR